MAAICKFKLDRRELKEAILDWRRNDNLLVGSDGWYEKMDYNMLNSLVDSDIEFSKEYIDLLIDICDVSGLTSYFTLEYDKHVSGDALHSRMKTVSEKKNNIINTVDKIYVKFVLNKK